MWTKTHHYLYYSPTVLDQACSLLCFSFVLLRGWHLARICGAVGRLEWVQCAWHAGLDVGNDQPLQALHEDRGERDRELVIWACHLVFVGQWDDDGLHKAGGDYSLGQGQVEDVWDARRLCDYSLCWVFFMSASERESTLSSGAARVFLNGLVLSASKRVQYIMCYIHRWIPQMDFPL
jgi:hypothetical protein